MAIALTWPSAALARMPGAEQVWFYPFGGSQRQIYAIVERDPVQVQAVSGVEIPTTEFLIDVLNDGTTGVDAPQVGKDTFQLKEKVQDVADSTFKLVSIVTQDEGFFRFVIRK